MYSVDKNLNLLSTKYASMTIWPSPERFTSIIESELAFEQTKQ